MDMNPRKLSRLTRQVKYNSLIYVVPWLPASIGADAAYNDLSLYKTLIDYSTIDKPVAEVAIKYLKKTFLVLDTGVGSFFTFFQETDQR